MVVVVWDLNSPINVLGNVARSHGSQKRQLRRVKDYGEGSFLGLRPKVIPCLTGFASRFESGLHVMYSRPIFALIVIKKLIFLKKIQYF